MTTTNRGLRRLVAGAGTLALTAGVLLAGGSPALAAPAFGTIDPDADGTIIIHKHEHQGTDTPVAAAPDGSGTIATDPVAGVTFTVYELRHNGAVVDLTEPEAWDGLADLTVNASCSAITGGTGYTLGDAVGAATTGTDGLATVALDAIGGYVVCETNAPVTVTDKAAPFIVTVPLPYGNGWLYDVNVYPKNAVSTVDKTINAQQGLGLGSLVEFPVTVRVPALEPGGELTGFDVSDTFDDRLTPAAAADGAAVGVKKVTVAGTELDAAQFTASPTGQKVLVSLDVDDPAVAGLLKANPGADVVVTFQARVTSIGTGAIANTATAYVNNPADGDGDRARPGVESPVVTSNWGDLTILKTDAATPATPLEGAEFQVFAALVPYPATAAACSAAFTGAALSVGGDTTFTSDEDGLVRIPGLFVGDSENGDHSFRCYVVVESRAPAGFVTPLAPSNAWAVDVIAGQTGGYDLAVANTQQAGPALPLTGAGGTLALTIGGLLLIGLGSVAILVSRRRQRVVA